MYLIYEILDGEFFLFSGADTLDELEVEVAALEAIGAEWIIIPEKQMRQTGGSVE